MPETITSFTDFAPGTPARANEVDANFANFRGTLLPINTDTASASNATHNLGATDHYWNRAYTVGLYTSWAAFTTMTTTSSMRFTGSSSWTHGGMFLIQDRGAGSTTICAYWTDKGMSGLYIETGTVSNDALKNKAFTTSAGGWDAMYRVSLATLSKTFTVGAANLASITVSYLAGRLMHVELVSDSGELSGNLACFVCNSTISEYRINIMAGNSTLDTIASYPFYVPTWATPSGKIGDGASFSPHIIKALYHTSTSQDLAVWVQITWQSSGNKGASAELFFTNTTMHIYFT